MVKVRPVKSVARSELKRKALDPVRKILNFSDLKLQVQIEHL